MKKQNLIEFYRLLYPNGQVENFCKRIFKVSDSDNSGEIDFVELMMSLSVTTSLDIRKKVNLAFRFFDVDNSGIIKKQELIYVVESIYDLTTNKKYYRRQRDIIELVEEIMENFDSNKNNYLTKDEFIDGCLNNPSLAEFILPYA